MEDVAQLKRWANVSLAAALVAQFGAVISVNYAIARIGRPYAVLWRLSTALIVPVAVSLLLTALSVYSEGVLIWPILNQMIISYIKSL